MGAPTTSGRHGGAMLRAAGTLAALAAALVVATVCVPAGAEAAPLPRRQAPPVLDDLRGARAREADEILPLRLVGLGALPTARQTTVFSAGTVAVSVIFVESDGSIDRDRESWTRRDAKNPGDRRANALRQVGDALAWWNERSPDGSLMLFLPAAGDYGAPRTVTTGYEPITRPTDDFEFDYRRSDAGWRWQIMKKLGFSHDSADDEPPPERAYADQVRRRNGADWAFVVYVVDSLRDADGQFPDGAVAYTADLYGPYTVLTYDNDGYGFENFGAVLAHETGHEFGALDEYAPPYSGYPSTGNLQSGYLGVRNRNAVKGGTTDLPCIMRGSQETLDAYEYGDLCPSTIGQAGFRDGDADLRPDVVDTEPLFTAGTPMQLAGGRVSLSGSVQEQPWPHGYSTAGTVFVRDISIFVPHDVQYRVDGGDWLPVTALDGAFDEPSEKWKFTTASLPAGAHVLEVQGVTGGPSGLSMEVTTGP